jgi:hypothetical protein
MESGAPPASHDVERIMNLVDILRSAVLALRRLGPYALLELLMPGGTILALLLYLYRRRVDASERSSRPPVDFLSACSS